jgi:hypothetical protein
MAIDMLNPLVKGEFVLTSQVERVRIYTLPTYNTKGLNQSTNNSIRTFRELPLTKGLNLAKKYNLDKKWAIFFYK